MEDRHFFAGLAVIVFLFVGGLGLAAKNLNTQIEYKNKCFQSGGVPAMVDGIQLCIKYEIVPLKD